MSLSHSPSIVRSGLVLHLDAANPRSYSKNVHPYPTDLYSWVTTGQTCTLTRDTISSPVGNKPLKMVISGTDPYTYSYNGIAYNLAPALSGQTWTVSVWVNPSVASSCQLFILSANSSGNYIAGSNSDTAITPGWQRISYTYTLTDALTTFVQVRLDGPNNGGTGTTIWWDGLQVEKSSTMSVFNSQSNTDGINWKDLSGNNRTGTLTNTPGYDVSDNGSIVCDGINDMIPITNSGSLCWAPTGAVGFSNITIDIWIKSTDASGVIYSKPWNGSGQYNIRITPGNFQLTCGTTGQLSNNITFGQSIATGTWTNIVCWANETNMGYYLNSTLYTSQKAHLLTGDVPSAGNGGVLSGLMSLYPYGSGWVGNTGFSIAGNISICKLYNRALSAAEVNQNFEATRDRYGI